MPVPLETVLLGGLRLDAPLERQRRETYQPGLKAQEEGHKKKGGLKARNIHTQSIVIPAQAGIQRAGKKCPVHAH